MTISSFLVGLGLRESHADADGIGAYGAPDAH